MKKLIFHLELLTSLGVVTGKEKRAAKILTSDQQQALQGLAGTSFNTRDQGCGPAKQGWFCCSRGAEAKEGVSQETGWHCLSTAKVASEDPNENTVPFLCACFQRR
jgi:hypothetical protein